MRARGNGEGSIWYREDRGRWVAALSLPGGARRTKTARTQREAQRWLIEQRARIQQGDLPGKRQRLGEYLVAWLETVEPTVKPTTQRTYGRIVALHLVPALGRHELTRLSAQAIESYKAEKLSGGLSPQSVRGHLSLLSHALADAVRTGALLRNPCAAVDPPRVTRPQMQVYSETDARRFLDAARGERLEALYILAITTGMRQGEILALRPEDVDLDAPCVLVRRTLSYHRGQFTFPEPKGGRARAIALTTLAVDALLRRAAAIPLERAAAREDWQEHGLLFVTRTGRPIIPQDLRTIYRRFIKRAGLPSIRFHDLRHTMATLLLEQGEHVRVVQEMLGHSTAALTLDIYSHVSPALQQATVRRLQERLSAPVATAPQPAPGNGMQDGEE